MIILESKTLKVSKIIKRTRAKMFEDLKVGSIVKMSVPVKAAGSSRGTYATYIKIENLDTGAVAYKSFNEMWYVLANFEFEEVTN